MVNHELAYESPLSVRKVKIIPENSAESLTLAWCENEQSSNQVPLRNDGKCHRNDNVNDEDDRVTSVFPITSVVAQDDERIVFINNAATNKPTCSRCICDKKKCKTSVIRSFLPWGIPWAILTNSFIQITIHFMGCDDTFNHLVFSPFKKQDIWRFITYHYLHSGSTHLFLNVFLQLLVATPLETEQGHLKTLAVYLGGILFGALGSALFNPSQAMIGASAGVYSLLISHISHCVLNFSTLSYRYCRLLAVFALCLSDVIFVSYHFYRKGNLGPKISLSAHASGAIAGLLLGFIIFSTSKETTNYYRHISFILCCVFVIIFPFFTM